LSYGRTEDAVLGASSAARRHRLRWSSLLALLDRREEALALFRLEDMTNIKLLLVTALAVLAAAVLGRTLSSDPEWRPLAGKGTDVTMEELTLSSQSALTGDVAVSFF
jgi:hypothetical protein